MNLKCRQVDSFTATPFTGNPAAVCITEQPLPDKLMQQIAMENNLSETAFLVPAGPDRWKLRWFTPEVEVELCGHATLAAAHLLFLDKAVQGETVFFDTLSGELQVSRADGLLWLDLPAWPPEPEAPHPALEKALGCPVLSVHRGGPDLAVRTTDEAAVAAARPDFLLLLTVPGVRAVSVTAPGTTADFVSRCFAPAAGINEDPVTGSAHCLLVPYWARELGRASLSARQISARGGDLQCRLQGDRVLLGGTAVPVKESTILNLPD